MLSLLPVLTGGAGAIFNDSTKALTDLFFFMPISEPMKKQDTNPYITPVTLAIIMFLLKLITIAPAQTVTGIIMAVSNRKPVDNQFAMFFPMVLFILVGFLFYQEYKNKTYINWITYGYPKYKLFLADNR